MAQIIKHRRGTVAQLDSYGALQKGELGVTTGSVAGLTTPIVHIGGGAVNYTIGRLFTGTAVPNISSYAQYNGQLFFDTDDSILYNLQSTGNTNLNLTGNIANRTIDGTLNITGIVSASSDLWVGGDVHAVGNITFEAGSSGTITLGDSSGDNIIFGADISSSLIPNDDDEFDLGSSGQQWKDLYINGTAYLDSATITAGTITGITDLVVADGGTGVGTFTDGGVLLGSGTGAITAMAVLGDGEFIVGDGSTDPVAESGDTARISLGVGTTDSPTFAGVNAGNINVGVTGDNEIDTDSGNLTLDSTGGEVIVDDVLRVTGNTQLSGSLLIEDAAATITHEGATSLTISSTNGTVLIEGSTFTGNDLAIPGDLTVSGTTTTIDSTTLNIGDNIIVLNTAGAATDGGIQIIDAVGTKETGSFLWNTTSDYWYSGVSGSTHYRVPQQASGGELTDNRVVLAQGNGRIESSANITDDGSTVDFNDVDLTSLVKLEGVDTNTYIDLGGSTLIVTKGTIQPSGHGGDDLGATGTRYANLWLSANADVDGTLDVAGVADFQSVVDAQASLTVTGSVYVSAGASVAAASASLVSFRNDSNTQLGYLASADTQAVTTGLVGYNTSTGNLTISSVVDGGSF
jgi:cytoskeletal protein CcmA (bactofilin family)